MSRTGRMVAACVSNVTAKLARHFTRDNTYVVTYVAICEWSRMAILVEEGLHPNGMDLVIPGGFEQIRTQEARRVFADGDEIDVMLDAETIERGLVRYRDGVPMILVGIQTPAYTVGAEFKFGAHRVRKVSNG